MLALTRYGAPTDAPPLLIAHGLFGSARNWGVLAKRLSDRREVIVPDMRNHGASPWFDDQDYDHMADDLAEVIDGTADILGHSMGGKAAMALALRHPGKVRRLIVADIAPVDYGHAATQRANIAAMRKVDPASVASRAEATEAMGLSDPAVAAFFLQSLDLGEKRWRMNLDVLDREMDRIVSFPDLSGAFDGPVLFLSGGASDYAGAGRHDACRRLFPQARFAEVAGAGHWLHAEKPREVEAAVRDFLEAGA